MVNKCLVISLKAFFYGSFLDFSFDFFLFFYFTYPVRLSRPVAL